MDSEQTLKILKMVQEGFLTPEQGQRLILELADKEETEKKSEKPEVNPPGDMFQMLNEVGRNLGEGFERLFEKAGQTLRSATGQGPQTILLKVLDADGAEERNQVSIPLKIFLALKPLMALHSPFSFNPMQQIDFEAIFGSLESGRTGKIFEYINRERDEKLEVWLI